MVFRKLVCWWRSAFHAVLLVALLFTPSQGSALERQKVEEVATNALIFDQDFQVWIDTLRNEARERGISKVTLDASLHNIAPLTRVIELDRSQAEFTQTFWTYLLRSITDERITRGQALLVKYQYLLEEIYVKYGVPPRYLIALWGLETNFGDNLGRFHLINTLVTLAYDNRRSTFFRAQLLDALRIIDEGHITPDEMYGSWAGAMGHMQFMPTTFIEHAVDYSGDGRKDIWSSLPDAFSSAANYLSNIGWRRGELWGREVRLPKDFDLMLVSLNSKRTVKEWSALGIRRANGQPLPQANIEGSIVLPQGYEGPAFLIYDNFRVILEWNRSINYALSVGHLADRIVRLPQIKNGWKAAHVPLLRDEVEEMQRLLNLLGFDAGPVDGFAGPRTRSAIRAFQSKFSFPPDGYPAPALLHRLRLLAEVIS